MYKPTSDEAIARASGYKGHFYSYKDLPFGLFLKDNTELLKQVKILLEAASNAKGNST